MTNTPGRSDDPDPDPDHAHKRDHAAFLAHLETLLCQGVSSSAAAVYISLYREGPASPSELTSRVDDLHHGTVCRAAATLEERGLVTKRPDLSDSRRTIYAYIELEQTDASAGAGTPEDKR